MRPARSTPGAGGGIPEARPEPAHRRRRRRGRRRAAAIAGIALLVPGALLLARDGYLRVKGVVAEQLIERAFRRHLADGGAHTPWSWADTHPVARLEVPRLRVRRHVLAGAHGPSLAFGPGHVDGTAMPNEPGNSVIAGHRDTWFAFLQDLKAGDRVDLQTRRGTRVWLVAGARVVAETDASVLAPTAGDRLTLLTCWPFSGLLASPWRYVVTLEPAPLPSPAGS